MQLKKHHQYLMNPFEAEKLEEQVETESGKKIKINPSAVNQSRFESEMANLMADYRFHSPGGAISEAKYKRDQALYEHRREQKELLRYFPEAVYLQRSFVPVKDASAFTACGVEGSPRNEQTSHNLSESDFTSPRTRMLSLGETLQNKDFFENPLESPLQFQRGSNAMTSSLSLESDENMYYIEGQSKFKTSSDHPSKKSYESRAVQSAAQTQFDWETDYHSSTHGPFDTDDLCVYRQKTNPLQQTHECSGRGNQFKSKLDGLSDKLGENKSGALNQNSLKNDAVNLNSGKDAFIGDDLSDLYLFDPSRCVPARSNIKDVSTDQKTVKPDFKPEMPASREKNSAQKQSNSGIDHNLPSGCETRSTCHATDPKCNNSVLFSSEENRTDSTKFQPDSPKKQRGRKKRAKDAPKRPLSAYNIFFMKERQKLLQTDSFDVKANNSHDDKDALNGSLSNGVEQDVKNSQKVCDGSNGKIGFKTLAQIVSSRWNSLSEDDKIPFKAEADVEAQRYKEAIKEYRERVKESEG